MFGLCVYFVNFAYAKCRQFPSPFLPIKDRPARDLPLSAFRLFLPITRYFSPHLLGSFHGHRLNSYLLLFLIMCDLHLCGIRIPSVCYYFRQHRRNAGIQPFAKASMTDKETVISSFLSSDVFSLPFMVNFLVKAGNFLQMACASKGGTELPMCLATAVRDTPTRLSSTHTPQESFVGVQPLVGKWYDLDLDARISIGVGGTSRSKCWSRPVPSHSAIYIQMVRPTTPYLLIPILPIAPLF